MATLPRKEWINPDYLNVVAVVFAWVATILPNITYTSLPKAQTQLIYFRFSFFQVLWVKGSFGNGEPGFSTPLGAISRQAGQTMMYGYIVWAVAALALLAALALSIALFTREDEVVERLPYHPARVMGGLLFAGGVLTTASILLLTLYGLPAIPISVGVVFYLIFGGVLLLNPTESLDTAERPGGELTPADD